MSEVVLTLNAGSSSIKFAVFDADFERAVHGRIENIGGEPRLVAAASVHTIVDKKLPGANHEEALDILLAWLAGHLGTRHLRAVGHRIVHGGADFTQPVRLTAQVEQALARLCPLAPLHQPHNLAAIAALAKLRPGLLQIGCFDTAFHATMDDTCRRYGLPRALEQRGIRKYGFHGLSYEFIAGRLKEIDSARAGGRIVVAHLGSGASLCAMRDGLSVDTSMGFTALDGLVMSTRCGALDPGVLLYLLRDGMSPEALEELLYHRSGLLGVSGLSEDMRALLASPRPEAAEAVDLFVFRIVREIAAMAASLGGLDGLIFTGGIGENAPIIRHRVAQALCWMGLFLDPGANEAGAVQIHGDGSRVSAWVIPTDEEQVIARHSWALADCARSRAAGSISGSIAFP